MSDHSSAALRRSKDTALSVLCGMDSVEDVLSGFALLYKTGISSLAFIEKRGG